MPWLLLWNEVFHGFILSLCGSHNIALSKELNRWTLMILIMIWSEYFRENFSESRVKVVFHLFVLGKDPVWSGFTEVKDLLVNLPVKHGELTVIARSPPWPWVTVCGTLGSKGTTHHPLIANPQGSDRLIWGLFILLQFYLISYHCI